MIIPFLAACLALTPATPPESLVAMLRRISEQANPLENRFLNRQRAVRLTIQALKTENRFRRFKFEHEAADEWIKSGATEKGIDQLERLLESLETWEAAGVDTARAAVRYSLAVGYLRLAESQNCVANHGVESCLFPIQGSGVHVNPAGALLSIEQLTWLVTRSPGRLDYRWLINLAYMALGQYPDAVPEGARLAPGLFRSAANLERFTDVAATAGANTFGLAGGANVEDFDGDGWLDLFCTSWGLSDPCHLLLNRGDGTFQDVSSAWGLAGQVSGLNSSHADYDNDGDPDMLILRGAWLGSAGRHPNSLLRNDGDRFTDVTIEAGLLSRHPTQVGEWGDYDQDGDLDLFIGNESSRGEVHPCELYRNDGNGKFVDVAESLGLAHVGYVKGASWGDFDNDGDLDLYCSVMWSKNKLFENLGPDPDSGKWHFRDVAASAGVQDPITSFATWFWDFDNDGWEDLLVCSYGSFTESMLQVIVADYIGQAHQDECFRLYRNLGDGTFREESEAAGLRHAALAMGANFGDIDNDGYLDAYFGTGQPDLGTLVPNRMFRNVAGERFEDVTTVGGFGHLQKGHGIAFADLDHDGDQDIFAVMGGAYQGDGYMNVLFENPGHGNHWITLSLEGVDSPRDATGSRVTVRVEGPDGVREIHRTVGTGGSFGCSTRRQELGLGRAERIVDCQIRWTAGSVQHFSVLEMDRAYRIKEGDGTAALLERPRVPLRRASPEQPASRPRSRPEGG